MSVTCAACRGIVERVVFVLLIKLREQHVSVASVSILVFDEALAECLYSCPSRLVLTLSFIDTIARRGRGEQRRFSERRRAE